MMTRVALAVVLLTGCSAGAAPLPSVRDFPDAGQPFGLCGIEWCVLPEECDGIDNDQDGQIDESEGMPLSQFCDTGGPCPTGAQLCQGGHWGDCFPLTTSQPETGALACDGVDNDCDGLVDEAPFVGGDVVFAVDRSGSMVPHLTNVSIFLDTFAARLGPSWRFAIVVFPFDNTRFIRWTDFVLYREAQAQIQRLATESILGSLEPSWDVLRAIGDNTLLLSWRPGAARFVILLTDEPGQSYATPPNTEATACSSFVHAEEVISYTTYPRDFSACGRTHSLLSLNELNTEISDPCSR